MNSLSILARAPLEAQLCEQYVVLFCSHVIHFHVSEQDDLLSHDSEILFPIGEITSHASFGEELGVSGISRGQANYQVTQKIYRGRVHYATCYTYSLN